MRIDFDKYQGILELVELIDGSEESVENFVTKFKRYTGINNIMLAEDDVFEIGELDFPDVQDLIEYFTLQDLVEQRYYRELLKLAEMMDSREEFCRKASNLTGAVIRQYGTVVRINNVDFTTKVELIDYLKAYEVFDKLAEMVYDFEIAENGRGVELDGIAYVHDCRQSMNDDPQDNFPMEGFLKDGKVEWKKVEMSAFREKKTGKGSVHMLNLLQEAKVQSIYLTKPNEFGIVEKPYPIAILPNKRYVFIFKSKDV